MKIDIEEKTDNKFTFHIRGVGHTFCNALKDTMVDMDHVSVVTYTIKHPLVADPKFFLETDGEDPVQLLEDAVDSLEEKNSTLLNEVSGLDV